MWSKESDLMDFHQHGFLSPHFLCLCYGANDARLTGLGCCFCSSNWAASLRIPVLICKMRIHLPPLWACSRIECGIVRKTHCILLGTSEMLSPWPAFSLLLPCLQASVLFSCRPGRGCLMPCTPTSCEAKERYKERRRSPFLWRARHWAGS